MAVYEMTYSLLSAWQYLLKENDYADSTNEPDDPFEEFMGTLKRIRSEPTQAMLDGLEFEDLVQKIAEDRKGEAPATHKWMTVAKEAADILKGSIFQCPVGKRVFVGDMELLLYGRLDALKGGHIYDLKFVKSYDRGKHYTSTQHPMYFKLIPEAKDFTYIVCKSDSLWTETYRRDETPDVMITVTQFMKWLEEMDFMETYKEYWNIENKKGRNLCNL